MPLVDANVRRVAMRLLGIRGQATPRHDATLIAFLREVLPADRPGDFNQALMELGALVCRARNPQCLACPVRSSCRAAREGVQEIIPKPKRLALERLEVVVAVIERDGRFLVQRRPPGGLLAGLWEFPGGKVEPGESLAAALRREVREELGAGVANVRRLTTVRHAYTRFLVTLHAFRCDLAEGSTLSPGQPRRWLSLSSLRRYPLPSGSVRIVDFLEARKKDPG
jgi:A/G-specific adenine glycosylase